MKTGPLFERLHKTSSCFKQITRSSMRVRVGFTETLIKSVKYVKMMKEELERPHH